MNSNEAYRIIKSYNDKIKEFDYYNDKYLAAIPGLEDDATFVIDSNHDKGYVESLSFNIISDMEDYYKNAKRFRINEYGKTELYAVGYPEDLAEYLKYK